MRGVRTLDPTRTAAIFAGGCLGALARAALVEAADVAPDAWPWPVLLANLAGALLLGYVAARPRPVAVHALLGPGFCGALTTFSALQVEVLDLADAGHGVLAAAYVAVSVAGGLAAVAAGRRLAGGRRPA
jgi:CrcB protein